MRKGSEPAPRPRTLDETTEQQAIAYAQKRIKVAGGLSHKHSQDYWRFSTKAELRGPVEADVDRFLQDINDAFKEFGEVSVRFLPGPPGTMTWNDKLLEKLIVDAEQGDADADQVLREAAAECLERGELPPKPLLIYAATSLRAHPRRKHRQQPNSSKPQSHKTDYRDWILAFTVDDVARQFNLRHTRNDATESKGKHCACLIVALAIGRHENTVQNAWHNYKGVADQRTPTNYVWQARVSVTSDDGAQWHYLVRFPRVGSPEAMPVPANRKAQRAKRARN
jgi:hypothetical protein